MPVESTADALGVELARAVRTQADAGGTGLSGFARALSLDADRLLVELIHPHPELGRAYGIGRTFARHCNCSHELRPSSAARAYIEQLPPMLSARPYCRLSRR